CDWFELSVTTTTTLRWHRNWGLRIWSPGARATPSLYALGALPLASNVHDRLMRRGGRACDDSTHRAKAVTAMSTVQLPKPTSSQVEPLYDEQIAEIVIRLQQ